MTSVRPMHVGDIYRLEEFAEDEYTEIYPFAIYVQLLSTYRHLSLVAECQGHFAAFIIGTVGEDEEKCVYGHVSSLSVLQRFRRQKCGAELMSAFELACWKTYKCSYINLYVHVNNEVAITFYRKIGYNPHATLNDYYEGPADALEMRKQIPRGQFEKEPAD